MARFVSREGFDETVCRADEMTASIRLAGTDVNVSRLSFGTASLHHVGWTSQRRRLLEVALANGLTHFDCAPYYGHGLAEHDLGELMARHRDACTVTTKVGLYPKGRMARSVVSVWVHKAAGRVVPSHAVPEMNWSIERSRRSLEGSLRALRTDHVDFLLVHEPRLSPSLADDLTAWLGDERRRGTLRAFGVAGIEDRVRNLVSAGHPIAAVVQTKDSIGAREAAYLLDAGRPLQFTYGYLSAARSSPKSAEASVSVQAVLAAALARNRTGSVIISTRRPDRIREIAKILE